VDVLGATGRALAAAGSMGWEILWALILGFGLSAVVQAVVSKDVITRWRGDDNRTTAGDRADADPARPGLTHSCRVSGRRVLATARTRRVSERHLLQVQRPPRWGHPTQTSYIPLGGMGIRTDGRAPCLAPRLSEPWWR